MCIKHFLVFPFRPFGLFPMMTIPQVSTPVYSTRSLILKVVEKAGLEPATVTAYRALSDHSGVAAMSRALSFVGMLLRWKAAALTC